MTKTALHKSTLAAAKEAAKLKEELEAESLRKKLEAEDVLLAKRQHEEEESVKIALAPLPSKKIPTKILEEYKKKYNREPDENGMLVFPSRDAAVEFFSDLAHRFEKFMATEYKNGQRTDFHVFSCGDGKLYQGTYAEIAAELLAACKANPDNVATAEGYEAFKAMMPSPSPSVEMRERLQEQRQASAAVPQENVDQPTSAPTPKPTRAS